MTIKSYEYQAFRDAVTEMLISPHNKYHLTLSPRKGCSRKDLTESINHFFVRMNQILYGKRYHTKGLGVTGIIMFEHTDKDNPHFHMIIQDPRGDLENRYSFDEVLRSVIPKLKPKHATHSNLDNRRLISNDSWCLQEYYNNGNYDLEKYLSKEFNRNEGAAKAHLDNFSTINVDGVEFGLRYEKVYPEIRILTAQ